MVYQHFAHPHIIGALLEGVTGFVAALAPRQNKAITQCVVALFCCGSPMTGPPRIAVRQLRKNTRKKAAKNPAKSACSGSDPLHRAKIRRSRLRDLLILLWLIDDRTPANCRQAITQEHAQKSRKTD
ncbi:MAG: hypothetical protein II326_05275 [Clostridia bacterium]|nr:hypothetical protein [Clostridia bacterium]